MSGWHTEWTAQRLPSLLSSPAIGTGQTAIRSDGRREGLAGLPCQYGAATSRPGPCERLLCIREAVVSALFGCSAARGGSKHSAEGGCPPAAGPQLEARPLGALASTWPDDPGTAGRGTRVMRRRTNETERHCSPSTERVLAGADVAPARPLAGAVARTSAGPRRRAAPRASPSCRGEGRPAAWEQRGLDPTDLGPHQLTEKHHSARGSGATPTHASSWSSRVGCVCPCVPCRMLRQVSASARWRIAPIRAM